MERWRKSSYSYGNGGNCVEVDTSRAAWRKSGYSDGTGGNCVEVGTSDAAWRKSSYSEGHGGNCVEVAETAEAVFVRDTQNRDLRHLGFSGVEWGAFLRAVRDGRL